MLRGIIGKQAEPVQILYLSGFIETRSCVPIRCTKRHAKLLRVNCEFDSRRGCQKRAWRLFLQKPDKRPAFALYTALFPPATKEKRW